MKLLALLIAGLLVITAPALAQDDASPAKKPARKAQKAEGDAADAGNAETPGDSTSGDSAPAEAGPAQSADSGHQAAPEATPPKASRHVRCVPRFASSVDLSAAKISATMGGGRIKESQVLLDLGEERKRETRRYAFETEGARITLDFVTKAETLKIMALNEERVTLYKTKENYYKLVGQDFVEVTLPKKGVKVDWPEVSIDSPFPAIGKISFDCSLREGPAPIPVSEPTGAVTDAEVKGPAVAPVASERGRRGVKIRPGGRLAH